jgi:hypothetical protein
MAQETATLTLSLIDEMSPGLRRAASDGVAARLIA